MLNVACIKWGTKYGAEYVHRLRDGVARNLKADHRFVCITDNAAGLDCEVIAIDSSLRGWWQKVTLFRRDPYGLTGRIFYLDLDVVITGALEPLIENSDDFSTIRDFCRPSTYNSSVMLLNAGSHPEVAEDFDLSVTRKMHGDQDWITERIRNAHIWPHAWVRSYKLDHQQERPTPGTRVVVFHGVPKPHECGGWVEKLWR